MVQKVGNKFLAKSLNGKSLGLFPLEHQAVTAEAKYRTEFNDVKRTLQKLRDDVSTASY